MLSNILDSNYLPLRTQYQCNLLFYAAETTVKQIEDAFKEFTAREDIAIVLISQYVSGHI
jgi:vacuolar-type H+-ATPase subunit F/Vma7